MNSATKPSRVIGLLALLAAVSAFGLLASGCGDYGPTNLYSNPLFGQTQSGGSAHFWTQEFALSATAGTANGEGPDQYVIYMKNVGSGGLIGPVSMTVTVASGCGQLEAYTSASGAPGSPLLSQIVTFGYAGQAIYSGDTLVGSASNPGMGASPNQYSFQVGFAPATCSQTAQTFNYTARDSKGDSWSGTFSGTNI